MIRYIKKNHLPNGEYEEILPDDVIREEVYRDLYSMIRTNSSIRGDAYEQYALIRFMILESYGPCTFYNYMEYRNKYPNIVKYL